MSRTVWKLAGIMLLQIGASAAAAEKREKAEAVTAQQAGEYQVKAAFLYNFTKFVEWRGGAGPGPGRDDEIVICASGPAARTGAVLDTLRSKKGLQLRQLKPGDEPRGCAVLFQAAGDKPIRDSWAELAKSGVLVVTEDPRQVARGSILNFFLADGKVRFEANIESAKASGFRLNSQLLQLARIVKAEDGRE